MDLLHNIVRMNCITLQVKEWMYKQQTSQCFYLVFGLISEDLLSDLMNKMEDFVHFSLRWCISQFGSLDIFRARNTQNFKDREKKINKSETICFQEHFGFEWRESSRGVYRRDARPAICLWVTASQGYA